jgi:hypothetical protein
MSYHFAPTNDQNERCFLVARILIPHAPHPLHQTVVKHQNSAVLGATFQVLQDEQCHPEYLLRVVIHESQLRVCGVRVRRRSALNAAALLLFASLLAAVLWLSLK